MPKQAAQQGAAPDRLQLRSSFLLAALPAAGELSVVLRRAAWMRAISYNEDYETPLYHVRCFGRSIKRV